VKPTDVVVPASQQAFYDRFHFAPAVRSGGLLLCSGQIGTGPDGRPQADPAEQFGAAFEQVGAVLREAGLDFSDVVELTTFHVGMQHLRTFAAVKDRYLGEPYPAWTAIGVSELAFPGGLAEVRATARLRATRPRPKSRAAGNKSRAAGKTPRAGRKRARAV
jgi:enamine deaminase RidA (YjgF/YER057c/UK114 family)